MSFYQAPWAARKGVLGDEAEAKYDEIYGKSTPLGLNRPEISLAAVPYTIRGLPDRLVADRMVECIGFGRDGVIKIRTEKLQALLFWDQVFPTYIFLWDSAAKRHATVRVGDFAKACEKHAELQRFPEGKPAWFLRHDKLDAEWITDGSPSSN